MPSAQPHLQGRHFLTQPVTEGQGQCGGKHWPRSQHRPPAQPLPRQSLQCLRMQPPETQPTCDPAHPRPSPPETRPTHGQAHPRPSPPMTQPTCDQLVLGRTSPLPCAVLRAPSLQTKLGGSCDPSTWRPEGRPQSIQEGRAWSLEQGVASRAQQRMQEGTVGTEASRGGAEVTLKWGPCRPSICTLKMLTWA